jgi:hypothetical protein
MQDTLSGVIARMKEKILIVVNCPLELLMMIYVPLSITYIKGLISTYEDLLNMKLCVLGVTKLAVASTFSLRSLL